MPSEEFSTRLAGVWGSLVALHPGGAAMSSSSSGREREQFIAEFLYNCTLRDFLTRRTAAFPAFSGDSGFLWRSPSPLEWALLGTDAVFPSVLSTRV